MGVVVAGILIAIGVLGLLLLHGRLALRQPRHLAARIEPAYIRYVAAREAREGSVSIHTPASGEVGLAPPPGRNLGSPRRTAR